MVIQNSVPGVVRRRVALTSLLLLAGLALTACGSASSTTADTTPPAAAVAPAAVSSAAENPPAAPSSGASDIRTPTRCSELNALSSDDLAAALVGIRFATGLPNYDDSDLLSACKKSPSSAILKRARSAEIAAQDRLRAIEAENAAAAAAEPVTPAADDTADDTPDDPSLVTREEFGADWPLTVDEATLACDGSNGVGATTLTANGTTYSLNGFAKQKADENGWHDLHEIWADNPDFPGVQMSVGDLVDRALSLCT